MLLQKNIEKSWNWVKFNAFFAEIEYWKHYYKSSETSNVVKDSKNGAIW